MTNNKKINIILSVILAVILWAYVINEANPMTTKTFRDVPITYLNMDIMDENGYAILSSDFETVSLTIVGQRSTVTNLEAEDILVTADVMEVAKGENEVELIVVTPTNIQLDSIDKKNLTVNIENKISKEAEAKIVFRNLSNEQEEPIVIDMAKRTFNISGAETLIASVDHMEIAVDANDVDDEMRTLKVTAIPVDSNGTVIRNLTVEEAETTVTVVNSKTKTVELNVNVENDSDGYYLRTYSAPKTITIKGYDEYLSEIETVETEAIDISNLTESEYIDIVPVLPENVYAADVSKGLKLDVTVKKYLVESFSLNDENIELINLSGGLEYSITQNSFKVTVKATEDVMSSLVEDDFKLVVDSEDLGVGSHYLEINVTTGKDVYSMDLSPNKIWIKLSN